MRTVYGVPLSPFVRKVRLALQEKGLDYDLDPIAPFPPHNSTPVFRAMSPLGKVPAFKDGDFTISDSSVIISYLERKHPTSNLHPKGAEDCARALWFEEFADTKLVETIGPIFFNRVVKPNILKQESDQSVIDAALQALPAHFDYVESQLGDSDFIVGDSFSVGDLALGSMLRQHQIAGETVDAARWPKLAAYYERLASRPSFRKVIESESALMASMSG